MTYRKRSRQARQRGWLAPVLIGLALLATLRLAATWFAAPGTSTAASGLPTADIAIATPAGLVLVRDSAPIAAGATATAAIQAAPAQPSSTSEAPAAAPAPAAPTPTITPVPLPEIGAEPIATLFPIAPPASAPEPPPASGSATGVPILMYHYIRLVDANSDPTGYNLSIPPEDFAQQLAWLHEQGYTAVPMALAQKCMRGESGCPAKPVALTFDDGYEDAFSTVLPLLQRYNMQGTFYIVNSFVGQPGYMTWEQLATLRDSGMEIGAHTMSHLNLTTLDQATAAYEISQSKSELDQRLSISVTSFCYPAGFYDANIEALVQAAGFSNATTTRWDDDYSDALALPRRRVAGGTALDGFVGMVAGP